MPDTQAPLPDDPLVLQQMLREAVAEIEKLQQMLARMQRHRYGSRSEQLSVDQLRLWVEEQEQAEAEKEAEDAANPQSKPRKSKPKPKRNHGELPAHLPRYEEKHDIDSKVCRCCGGTLHMIGEDRSEMLDIVPAKLQVKVIRRPRYACRACEEGVTQAEPPDRPMAGGMATSALIIHILVSKYCDGLPLYRQSQMLARQGVHLDRSTLSAWVGQACWWLRSLADLVLTTVLSTNKVFADETTLPVLDPGRGRTKTGRLWCYAVDDRPWDGPTHPMAAYVYTEDRKAEHAAAHLANFKGILQVDGYQGYGAVVKGRGDASIQLSYCWSHLRRQFYDLTEKSPLAAEMLARISKLYAIEAEIRRQPAEVRQAVRQERSRPLVEALHQWLQEQIPRLPGWSDLAKAMRYGLSHWKGLCLYLDDGRLEMDTNVVERSIRTAVVTRKASLFAGSDDGARHWAIASTLIETAKLNGVDPMAWLTDVLERVVSGQTKNTELHRLLPWNWAAKNSEEPAAAA